MIEDRSVRGHAGLRAAACALALAATLPLAAHAQEACKPLALKSPALKLDEAYRMAEERAKAWKADAAPARITNTILGPLKPDGSSEAWNIMFHSASANASVAVNTFRGQKFTVVENAFVRIVNQADNKELCRFNLSEKFPTTGLVMARLYRHGGEWKFAAMGEGVDGQTIKDMVGKIQALLG
mgnify:CR=1 FL=1